MYCRKLVCIKSVFSTFWRNTREYEKKSVNSWRFHGSGKISGFYIKDMTVRGYENNSKYEVGDYEENEIGFYCSDVIIKSFERR